MSNKPLKSSGLIALVSMAVMATAGAVNVPLDTADPANGLTDIYSATFDPPLQPGGDPFFGGMPPPQRAITLIPNPTGVANGSPRGIVPQPVDGSFLDIDRNPGNTQATLNGGVIYIAGANIVIRQGEPSETNIAASDIGIVLQNFAPLSVPIDGNGIAVFEIDEAITVADFSAFADITDTCTGPLCPLIPVLTLDMLRFRLIIDFDANFTSFTGDFQGQTANNSIVSFTANSIVIAPEITVTDSVPPPDDLTVPFGSVTQGQTATQTVTVTNDGNADLIIGQVANADPLAAPFSIQNDNCSGQTLAGAAMCTFEVQCAPAAIAMFNDTLDIPSNDIDEPSVAVDVSCTGVPVPVPDINVTDSLPPPDDLLLPFGDVTESTFADALATVSNDGDADLILGTIGMVDPVGAPFSVLMDGCSGQTLAPMAICTFTVRFAPTMIGSFGDSVDIPSNDPDEASVIVTMNGDGIAIAAPDITVTDTIAPMDDLQLPFPDVVVDFTNNQTVVVTNDGNADLIIGNVAQANPLAAPFTIETDNCSGVTLPMAASCDIAVRFAPQSIATFNDSFDIPSNDPDEPSVTFNVSGDGVASTAGERLSTEPGGASGGPFGSAVSLAGLAGLFVLVMLPAVRRRVRSR
ncbi:MAG: choice-of-anchor D domain-containing protein [Gammaproteobacteria bacterium]|nr:choice-of-anchor D domain-containing protein [Gammaproteobacteria bacterium]